MIKLLKHCSECLVFYIQIIEFSMITTTSDESWTAVQYTSILHPYMEIDHIAVAELLL